MEWLLSVSDSIVEITPSFQQFPDGGTFEVMVTIPRSDLYLNLPALRKLDAMLVAMLDGFHDSKFFYVDHGLVVSDHGGNDRRCSIASVSDGPLIQYEEKWWLPFPKVPVKGLSEKRVKPPQEEERDPYKIPSKQNMRMALFWLVQGCQSGDSLVFHYSGHGSRQMNYNGDEVDGYDETLCPLDFETHRMIVDDEINASIVKPLAVGVKLHAIIDAFHSGTVLDLPFLCRMSR